MKISDRNTALHFLDPSADPIRFTVSEDSEHLGEEYAMRFCQSVIREFPKIRPAFAKRVRFLSAPFYAAYRKAADKMLQVIDQEPITESGTFVATSETGGTNTIFYSFITEGKDKDFNVTCMVLMFSKSKEIAKPNLWGYYQRFPNGDQKQYVSVSAAAKGIDEAKIMKDVLLLILFIRYCELEIKVIDGGRKAHHVGQKYVNETRQRIEVLDSTWFTTIVRGAGFSVGAETGGFFRLQPYGPGLSLRKLMWILPFEKDGYSRKAKMLEEPKR